MKFLVVIVFCVSVVADGALNREKRQAGCLSAFNNVPSPCQNNPTNQVYFPHPTDASKFLQCDVFKRMYIIQCPQGERYDIATTTCKFNTVVTQPPIVVSTSAPQTGNPCTPQNLARNLVYFAVRGDPNHFIECDSRGTATVLACPSGLKWSQPVTACVYPPNFNPGTVFPIVTTQNPIGFRNPCNAQALAAGKYFFPHADKHKFIQCDPWGDVYINTCPSGLIWNNMLETCYSPYQVIGNPIG